MDSTVLTAALLVFLITTILLVNGLARSRRRAAELERRVDAVRRDADRAEGARRRILASLSHDLRSPLSAIIGYQELLADGVFGEVPERGRDALARIALASRELLGLIDAVVDVARLEAGEASLRIDPVEPVPILEAALARSSGTDVPRAATPELHVEAAIPPFPCDADRLRCMIELAIDAVTHASPGQTLRLRTRPRDDGGFTLHIPDTGLQPNAASPGDGHGLRLDLAARLARRLGGSLALEPDGATAALRLEIPAAPRIDAVRAGR